ncbi:MAG TPA: glycosyltransferase family 39 protein [Burkholderiaceae bacterium]|nr:glycosyltransferase family 39 protein [Burkholderiaceae bacterium]
MADPKKAKPFLWILFFFFCIAWFYTLSARTLVPSDEGRYAEIAREMVVSGDWITPRLNAIKYFEKPPLQMWVTALAFKAFGLGEWQARLWTGICGLLGILLTAYAGWRVFGKRVGVAAGLVLASSFAWAALGHFNTLDMGLSGMMTLALCALLLGQRDHATPTVQRNWMLACWTGMALAVLSKGLIGVVLPGTVLVLYTLWSRDWTIWKRLHFGPGLLLFLAIAAPWFVLVSLKNPEFPHFFFIREHFERFASKVHHRYEPWYYFILILSLGIMPWLGMLAQSLWGGLREEAGAFRPKKLLLAWTGFIFVFFSFSDSKLSSYILPIFPALALLIAVYLQTAPVKSWVVTASLVAVSSTALLTFISRVPRLAKHPAEVANYQASQSWIAAAGIVMLVGALFVLWRIRRKRGDLALTATIALAISGFICGQLLLLGTETHGRYRAGLPLVPAIQTELMPDTKIYAVGMYDQTLPFYLRRTMILVEYPDELAFGLRQEPGLWLPTRAAFIEQWKSDSKSIAVMRPAIFAKLQEQGLPMRILARDTRRVIVTNDLKK